MKKIITFFAFQMLLSGSALFAVTTAALSTITATPGNAISIPLTVTNFTSVSSIGLVITIDPTLLTYTSISNINASTPGMTAAYVPATTSVNISWFASAQPFPTVNGQLCVLNFTFLGPGPATLVFASSCEVTTGLPPVDLTVTYTNGLVNTTYKPVNITLFLEGYFNTSSRTMNQAQGCTDGNNTFNNFTGTTVDTLSVYLAAATSPWGYVRQLHGVRINPNGTLSAYIPTSFTSNYYIVIKHRRSVETWSATAISFSGNPVTYNFTSAAGQAYGSNQKKVANSPSLYGLYGGDVTSMSSGQDGYVDIFDNNAVFNSAQTGAYGYMPNDVTGDGFVDIFDGVLVFNNMQTSVGMITPPNP
jgi:hypothetical protein